MRAPIHRPILGLFSSLLLFFGLAGAIALMPVHAAQNPATERIPASSMELIVFETDNCLYCFVFRRDVAPGYLNSPRAQEMPLRYINVSNTNISTLQLKAPITMVPTIVLMQNGRETDRIDGYMGPEPFFYMISRLMK